MSKDITVYTTNTCAYCLMVKKYLDSKGYEYKVVNLDEQPEEVETVTRLSGGQTVPVTVINSQGGEPSVTVGWSPAKLAEALNA